MNTSLRVRIATIMVLFALPAIPGRALSENKDLIQLQAQLQVLQDSVARLQQSNDERMGVLKDLVQQAADNVNRMSIVVNGLQKQMQNTQDTLTTKQDQESGQIQSLNDSIDELKARMGRMEKVLGDVQGQQQSATALLQSLPQGAPPTATGPSANTSPFATAPAPLAAPAPVKPQPLPAPAAGPAIPQQYQQALDDYMAAKYPLATSEFTDLVTAHPDDTLSGNAYFYLGEMETRSGKLTAAVKSYDHLIEHFPDNAKIPAAHLHKAAAMISMKQTDAGARELRTLIQRFPNSPEAALARTRLSSLGAAGKKS